LNPPSRQLESSCIDVDESYPRLLNVCCESSSSEPTESVSKPSSVLRSGERLLLQAHNGDFARNILALWPDLPLELSVLFPPLPELARLFSSDFATGLAGCYRAA
jgi:hypothetical protein